MNSIKPETLKFLQNLTVNNNRDWFNENKAAYTEAQENVITFLDGLIKEMSGFDEELGKIDGKKSLFRIYRDTRFSKDKSPYKTNFGAPWEWVKAVRKVAIIFIWNRGNLSWRVVFICLNLRS
ncbi:hypothetical protein BN1195_03832 [Chryseobacterium oranimense G311]|nr:hypothetical protein BN1195_03832 [Chryseobacterium oranimense G311]